MTELGLSYLKHGLTKDSNKKIGWQLGGRRHSQCGSPVAYVQKTINIKHTQINKEVYLISIKNQNFSQKGIQRGFAEGFTESSKWLSEVDLKWFGDNQLKVCVMAKALEIVENAISPDL